MSGASAGLDETHDPSRTSWVEGAEGGDFPVQNLPLGVFSPPGGAARAGVAIGDQVVDISALAEDGLLPEAAPHLVAAPLNALLAAPAPVRQALRRRLSDLLSESGARGRVERRLHPMQACALHLPARVGDYTDFYAGIHHARNIGALFRPEAPLLPNYKHVPIGYHGRASTVQVSGASVRRPLGQTRPAGEEAPRFGPSRRLDYELELGLWIGGEGAPGEPVPIGAAGGRIAGLCLLNDWSARDIQAWEYQPLGPFLAKSFATTVSPWIVTAEALAPFRTAPRPRPDGDPAPQPYLLDAGDQAGGALSLRLEVELTSARMRASGLAPHRLSAGAAGEALYWTLAQLVAHHTSNGCALQPGDLLGTGTLSTAGREGWGSLMELSGGGAHALELPGGETRTFLEDGDLVSMTARAEAPGAVAIGFGPCRGVVEPALAPR